MSSTLCELVLGKVKPPELGGFLGGVSLFVFGVSKEMEIQTGLQSLGTCPPLLQTVCQACIAPQHSGPREAAEVQGWPE